MRAAVSLLVLVVLAACTSPVAPLVEPNRVDSFCSTHPVHEYPKIDSMSSILTSIYEQLPAPGAAPTLERYEQGLKKTRGAIEYFDKRKLRLLKPELAKALGETDGYVVADEAVFNNETISDQKRWIYLHVRDHGTYRWQAVIAADTANVCSEGTRLM